MLGHAVGMPERRSWERSLPQLADDLISAGLAGVEVLVEHQLPLCSRRIDGVLCGAHPESGLPSYVVIELKQWSTVAVDAEAPNLCYVEGYGPRPVLHPQEQLAGYLTTLRDFTRIFEQPHELSGAVYLHNATNLAVADLAIRIPTDDGRLFTGDRRAEFQSWMSQRLSPAGAVAIADAFVSSPIAPSRQLLAVAAKEVQEREQFTLLDRQRIAYELVLRAVERSQRGDHKEVVLVTGGPGSGKSVIALSLLGELARQGRTVVHATGSKSFTTTLRHVAGRRNPRVRAMFRYFNQFIDAEQNGLDVIICDEAHRIRATSANRFTRAQNRTGRTQISELLAAARVPVFLLDQHQVVRPGEIGTVAEIREAAAVAGIDVFTVDLNDQFRCGGSGAYEAWVLRLLGLSPGGPLPWAGDERFDVSFSETPSEIESRLRAVLQSGLGARMAAGYCWSWSDPRSDGSLVHDVVVGDWHRPWNVKGERAVGGAPPASLWSTDPAGFDQVGCVYTAQGFEYDWSGLLIGPDLVWRHDRWVTRREFSKDPVLRRAPDAEFDRLTRNVYKVLLTRGMQGQIIGSTDPETQRFLADLIGVTSRHRVNAQRNR